MNDPTTAQDAIFHLAAVLREALVRDLPARVDCDDHGRRLLRPEDHTHDSLIELAFGEIRRTGAAQPRVAIYVLEALHLLHQAVIEAGRPERTDLLRRQAELVLAESRRSDALPVDSRDVEDAFRHRFGTQAPTTAGS